MLGSLLRLGFWRARPTAKNVIAAIFFNLDLDLDLDLLLFSDDRRQRLRQVGASG
jgi:hypothetical protein